MKLFTTMLILAVAFCLGMGCDSPTSPKNGTGALKVLLTDAPASYDAVNVTISEVAVHYSGGQSTEEAAEETDGEQTAKIAGAWTTVSTQTQTFNLLNLQQGVTALLANTTLPVGHYTQVRLTVSAAQLVIEGEEVNPDIDVPSGIIKLVSGFDIEDGEATTLLIDFDAARSVIQTGEGQYKLKPVIRIMGQEEAGSISGSVSNGSDPITVIVKITGTEEIVASTIVQDDGTFFLYVSSGVYDVEIVDSTGPPALIWKLMGVNVAPGESENIGNNIPLALP